MFLLGLFNQKTFHIEAQYHEKNCVMKKGVS